MRTQPEVIPSLLVPLHGKNLLLPNVAVAEVIPYDAVQPVAEAPEWLLGITRWRGQTIPVVSFEVVRGDHMPPLSEDAQLVVLNTVLGDGGVAFYAVVTAGIPHLRSVTPDKLEGSEVFDGVPSADELRRVRIEGEAAIIPDLKALEGLVAGYWNLDA